MIVCICKVVSDRTVKSVIASGARSVEEITAACRAGSGCGSCRETLQNLLDESACSRCPRQTAAVASPYLPTTGMGEAA